MAECDNISAAELSERGCYVRVNKFSADKAVVVHIGRSKSMVTFNATDEEAIALRNMLIATYRDVPVPPMANHKSASEDHT